MTIMIPSVENLKMLTLAFFSRLPTWKTASTFKLIFGVSRKAHNIDHEQHLYLRYS